MSSEILEDFDEPGYADYLYDQEKDEIGCEQLEELQSIWKAYSNHVFFSNDPDRLFKWLSDSLRLTYEEALRKRKGAQK